MTTDIQTLNSQVADIDWQDWTDEDIAWEAKWKSFLESGDPVLGEYLVEGQAEIVSLAAAPLTPILIAFAQSQLPHRQLALRVLASILSSRGSLEYEQQKADRGPVANPFIPGEVVESSRPDSSDLEDEAVLIHDMKKEIEASLADWIELATNDASPEVSLAALGLLSEIIHSPQMELAEQTIESVFESANQERRSELWYVMERMELAKRCRFCLSLDV